MNNKVSAKGIISEYIEDGDIQEVVDDSMFIRWIGDYDNMVGSVEELYHNISLLYVDNYKAILPNNFKKLQQVVARTKKDFTCSRIETVNKWVTSTFDPDCKIESELVCKGCHKKEECGCGIPVYEVEIDRQWQMSNPQHYFKGWSNAGTIGRGVGLKAAKQEQNGGWRLLRSAMDDMYQEDYFLNDCLNFNTKCDTYNSFKLEPPYLTVDFPEGEVIISYLGSMLDEDGDIMVSDDAHYLEGLIHHLDYKWWNREAKRHAFSGKTNMKLFKQYSNQAKIEREQSIGRYKARTVVPDYKDWNTFVDKVWNHRMPSRNFDQGLKRGERVSIFAKYDNLLRSGERIK